MASAWPATITQQQFSASGWSEARRVDAIRTPMDSGVVKTRRRFTVAVYDVKGSLLLDVNGASGNEINLFLAFWDTTLAGGSLPFTMTHPFLGTSVEYTPTGPFALEPEAPTLARVSMQLTR